MAALWNVLKAWLFLGGILVLFGLVGYAIGDFQLTWVFVFAGLLFCLGTYWVADRAVMGMLGGRELPEGENPAFHGTVAALSARAGIVKPRIYVIDRGPPLALVGGRGVFSSSLGVTASLLALPAPAEVEGIVAHELAHIRRRDVVLQTPVVMLSAALLDLSRIGGFLERPLLFVLGPVAAALQSLLLSPNRELAADRLGAEICESPHGLADALVRLHQATELVEFVASPATEPLYTVNPFVEEGLAGMFASHPPVAERVRRLRALAPPRPERREAA